jgi:uncharacterized protein YyaL (SSP411 family)
MNLPLSVPRNRLGFTNSPYLLAHADNPVDWYPWGEEALARARTEDKPILLSVGYATCHWCHVMERESFRDEAIAAYMNEHFVCIKVDREERPDIDEIYMTATVALTGHGGWPMTVFLTPSGDAFYAGTYFPPGDHWGRPGFRRILEALAQVWQNERQRIQEQGARISEHLRSLVAPKVSQAISGSLIDSAILQLRASFDEKWGGFDSAPKFPPHAALRLLADSHLRDHDANCLEMVVTTLNHLQEGGIHDHLAGGFARYSTDGHWHVPHFEKMLYDNAQLAEAFLVAYQVTKSEEYRRTLEGILNWVATELTAPEGGFYTGLDADSEGEEGRYYAFTWSEIQQALPSSEAEVFCVCFDIRPEGNWEGSNVLWTPRPYSELATTLGMDELALREQLSQTKQKLLEVRSERPRPLTDDKVLAGQTGLMLGAYAKAGRVLLQSGYIHIAERAAQFVLERMLSQEGQLTRVARHGQTGQPAMLDDYAYLADGLVELYEATGRARYLLAAGKLADRLLGDFFDDATQRLYHSPAHHEPLLLRIGEAHDGPTPNVTAVAASVLTRLSFLLERSGWRAKAETILRAHGQAAAGFPRGHCDMLRTARAASEPHTIVVVVPGDDSAGNEATIRACSQHCRPGHILAQLPKNPGPDELALPLFAARLGPHKLAQVYVCRDDYCSPPAQSVQEFERTLLTLV